MVPMDATDRIIAEIEIYMRQTGELQEEMNDLYELRQYAMYLSIVVSLLLLWIVLKPVLARKGEMAGGDVKASGNADAADEGKQP